MNTDALIQKILGSYSWEDIFPDMGEYKKVYLNHIKVLHPDVCDHPQASEAVAKLNEYKNILENGEPYKDEVCDIVCTGKSFVFTAQDPSIMKASYANYKKLITATGGSVKFFHLYLPQSMEYDNDTLKMIVFERSVPLSKVISHFGVKVPVEHVNWIFNRMMEFICLMADFGYVHAGLNPDSVLVLPENHGLVVSTFYHVTPVNGILKTISGNYQRFYDTSVFKSKIAEPGLDITLAKRTAMYMLGDKSAIGNSLHKTVKPEMLAFYRKKHVDPYEARMEYKDILAKNYEKKFHILHL